jgi:hypothetical protein
MKDIYPFLIVMLPIIAFIAGRLFPSRKWKEESNGILTKEFMYWYARKPDWKWKCIYVHERSDAGPFGFPLTTYILERNGERIEICSIKGKVKQGDFVTFRPQLPDEWGSVSTHIVDDHLIAELVTM